MVHDMFSLGVSLGGVVMVMLASVNVPDNGASSTGSGVAAQRFTQHRMLRASMWLLTVVVYASFSPETDRTERNWS